MNKQLANKGSTLSKTMTANENLTVNTITATSIILPVYVAPATPPNPVNGMIYLMHDPNNANLPYNLMIYDNNQWN